MNDRINWKEYSILLAEMACARSEDPFVKVGACILKRDGGVASLGYNGAPKGVKIDWSDREKRRKWVVHAELNALAKIVPSEDNWLIGLTMPPCGNCLKAIASYGITEIVYNRNYSSPTYGKEEDIKEMGALFKINISRIEFNYELKGTFQKSLKEIKIQC